ncbi:MAG: COQ9 family protein [Alphaproteobacteria bacterium]
MENLRDRIVLAALPHVVFDGWTLKTLREGARDAGLDPDVVGRAFPEGVVPALAHFFELGDRRMAMEMAGKPLEEYRQRERLALAVRCRLEPWSDSRDSLRRAMSLLSLPSHAAAAATCLYRTTDALWHAVGDTATGFDYYTKRGGLGSVYVATLLYWLNDSSEGSADTWHFLERSLTEMIRLAELRGRVERGLALLPNPLRLFRPRRRAGRTLDGVAARAPSGTP